MYLKQVGTSRFTSLNYDQCKHRKTLVLKDIGIDRHLALYLPLMGIHLVKP